MSIKPVPMAIVLAVLMVVSMPVLAQSAAQLQSQINQLKNEVEQIKAQLGSAPRPGAGRAVPSQQGNLSANIESIRVAQPYPRTPRLHATVVMTLINTGSEPLYLNYKAGSFNLVDSNGYQYEFYSGSIGEVESGVKGIPIAKSGRADARSSIPAGGTRKVTFTVVRDARSGQTIGNTFDVSATFVEVADLGEGRVKVTRELPVTITNVPLGGSSAGVGGQAVDGLGNQAMDVAGDKVKEKAGKLLKSILKDK